MVDGLRVVGVMDIRVTVVVTKHGQDVAGLCKKCQILFWLIQLDFLLHYCKRLKIPWKFDT